MTKRQRLRSFGNRIAIEITPSDAAWRGAAIAVLAFTAAIVMAYFATYFVQDFSWQKLPAFPSRLGAMIAIGVLILAGFTLLAILPWLYRVALAVCAPFLLLVFAPGNDKQSAVFTAIALLVVSLLGAGVAVWRQEGFYPRGQRVTVAAMTIGVVGLLGGLYAIFSEQEPANPQLAEYVLQDETLDLENPGLPGDFEVYTTTYGSGKDIRRPEFGDAVGHKARSVDGSRLIDNWDGLSGWLRTSYWGFDASELPLQARVWYPGGDGPFPLVLIVHGNHSMEDFSDPGYAYLGELFASRGIILASVDENFLNSSVSAAVNAFADRPGLREENDARGWLLLQHLAQWRDWNSEAGHPFENKIDMDRLALIGHSRGGEAVAVAASFNALSRYPDDATLAFDFGFNLRGVIAIAPVDGQYQPRDNRTPIKDVNYFTIHGSMDGDVQSFDGTAQYSRVVFSGDEFRFRSSLYVTGANHGQFNTTWGNMDTSVFRAWALNLGGIMDGEAQRDVAKVYFGAFMEVVLRDRREYLPIFSDARRAAQWLPDNFYINEFSTSADQIVADFEEDIDPATTTLTGGRIETQHLSKWYEVKNSLKSARRISQHVTHAAVYAWDSRFRGETASVKFVLPDDWAGPGTNGRISASLSDAGKASLPDNWQKENDTGDDKSAAKPDDKKPLDWTVRVTDRYGTSASLALSHDEVLYPQIQAIPRRASFLDGADPAEALFRRFAWPLADFVAASPALDAAALASIEFVFDRSDRGAIIIDELSVISQ